MRYFLLIFFWLVSFSGLALADCSNPEGPAGRQMYNSTYNVMQFCNGTDWIGMAGGVSSGGAGSATTMVSGWPDAIVCSSGSYIATFYYQHWHSTQVQYARLIDSEASRSYINYDPSTKAYSDSNMTGYDCIDSAKSITTLYAEGKAFNFIGNNGASTNLNEIGDVSVAAPSDGQALVWSDGNSRWEAGSAGITSESDPQVSAVTDGKWCRGDGSAVTCDQDAPSSGGTTYTDYINPKHGGKRLYYHSPEAHTQFCIDSGHFLAIPGKLVTISTQAVASYTPSTGSWGTHSDNRSITNLRCVGY